jgi:hypothetical protein
MYKKGDEKAGLIVKYGEREDYMNDGEGWLFASKADAIKKEWAEETDFDEL